MHLRKHSPKVIPVTGQMKETEISEIMLISSSEIGDCLFLSAFELDSSHSTVWYVVYEDITNLK
jgi:hypothetical protein